MLIYLTPLIPLSFKGEGEEKKEGLSPLLDTPHKKARLKSGWVVYIKCEYISGRPVWVLRGRCLLCVKQILQRTTMSLRKIWIGI
jgi:hypothetical protein